MPKINTENIHKYLQQQNQAKFIKSLHFSKNQADLRNIRAFQKIRQFWKILAHLQKSGGFGKYWRFYKNQADLENIGAFTKIRRIWKMLAEDRILAGIEIPAPGEKPAELEKAGGPLTV
jgi:hypothetical protein